MGDNQKTSIEIDTNIDKGMATNIGTSTDLDTSTNVDTSTSVDTSTNMDVSASEGTGKGYENMLLHIAGALTSGQTAFGAKTSRGFGRVTCDKVQKREFDFSPGNVQGLNDWLDFDWKDEVGWRTLTGCDYPAKYETLSVNLQLDGSIMIRDTRNIYEKVPEEQEKPEGQKAPDYKHLSIKGKPVILGTSWAGAFRSWLYKLLIQIQKYPMEKAEAYLNDVFGYVTDEDKESSSPSAAVSKIMFGVSELTETDRTVEGYRTLKRVKIDRFTGGAADGALFDETPWFGGNTSLEIRYLKEHPDIRELVLLVLEGIDKELLQIGGETSVGRGFFKILSINGEPKDTVLDKRKDALLQVISTWEGGCAHEN
jgi:CRISPR/Cas system CSM-associated protein Csm3 (group 7 of RAMP superfamily)